MPASVPSTLNVFSVASSSSPRRCSSASSASTLPPLGRSSRSSGGSASSTGSRRRQRQLQLLRHACACLRLRLRGLEEFLLRDLLLLVGRVYLGSGSTTPLHRHGTPHLERRGSAGRLEALQRMPGEGAERRGRQHDEADEQPTRGADRVEGRCARGSPATTPSPAPPSSTPPAGRDRTTDRRATSTAMTYGIRMAPPSGEDRGALHVEARQPIEAGESRAASRAAAHRPPRGQRLPERRADRRAERAGDVRTAAGRARGRRRPRARGTAQSSRRLSPLTRRRPASRADRGRGRGPGACRSAAAASTSRAEAEADQVATSGGEREGAVDAIAVATDQVDRHDRRIVESLPRADGRRVPRSRSGRRDRRRPCRSRVRDRRRESARRGRARPPRAGGRRPRERFTAAPTSTSWAPAVASSARVPLVVVITSVLPRDRLAEHLARRVAKLEAGDRNAVALAGEEDVAPIERLGQRDRLVGLGRDDHGARAMVRVPPRCWWWHAGCRPRPPCAPPRPQAGARAA